MNPTAYLFKRLLAAGVLLLLPAVSPVSAAPAAAAVPETVTKSVFILPTNPKEGHDPFFPNSSRPYESATAGKPHLADVSSLVLRGVSGPPDHRLAIINNHTFGIGDESDLVTTQGRVHIRLVEVRNDSVVIETGGMTHELKYPANP